jgi:hypothetical protein
LTRLYPQQHFTLDATPSWPRAVTRRAVTRLTFIPLQSPRNQVRHVGTSWYKLVVIHGLLAVPQPGEYRAEDNEFATK